MAQVPKALTLVRQRAPKTPGKAANNSPIARVLVDTGVFHLDQEFDFLVPEELSEIAKPGVSVRVPFNGRKCEGYIVGRANSSAHIGRMQFLDKVNDWPLAAIIYTDISKDGMLSGPNVDTTALLASKAKPLVIASGGVSSVNDIKNLKIAGVKAAIVGKALYDGKMTLQNALEAAAG